MCFPSPRSSLLIFPVQSSTMAARNDFPYNIPGPAGSDFNGVTSGFNYDNWHLFLRARELKPYGTNRLDFSISQVVTKALRRDDALVRLAARVKSITQSACAAELQVVQVVLEDSTGSITASLPEGDLKCRGVMIREGSILVLNDIRPCLNLSYVSSGFNINYSRYVHFSFTCENVAGHYPEYRSRPPSYKPLTLSIYKEPVATDRIQHVELLKQLRAELAGEAQDRTDYQVELTKARRGVGTRKGTY